MKKQVSTGVLFLAGGAIIGGLAGYGIEHSSLIEIFSGKPSMMAGPGEHIRHYSGTSNGLIPLVLGAIGAIGGAIVGWIAEAAQKNNEKTPSA